MFPTPPQIAGRLCAAVSSWPSAASRMQAPSESPSAYRHVGGRQLNADENRMCALLSAEDRQTSRPASEHGCQRGFHEQASNRVPGRPLWGTPLNFAELPRFAEGV